MLNWSYHLLTRTAKDVATNQNQLMHLYQKEGFKVQTILLDNEFNKVKDELPHTIINMTAANEHVADVEQHIHIIKE